MDDRIWTTLEVETSLAEFMDYPRFGANRELPSFSFVRKSKRLFLVYNQPHKLVSNYFCVSADLKGLGGASFF